MHLVGRDLLRDLCRWGVSEQTPEQNGTDAVQVALRRHFAFVLSQEVLYVLAVDVHATVVTHRDLHELLADLDLLWGDVLL